MRSNMMTTPADARRYAKKALVDELSHRCDECKYWWHIAGTRNEGYCRQRKPRYYTNAADNCVKWKEAAPKPVASLRQVIYSSEESYKNSDGRPQTYFATMGGE